jgi:hypothetical protein
MNRRFARLFLSILCVSLFTGTLAATPFINDSATERTQPDDPDAPANARITYTLSMPQPQTHYFEVEMRLQNAANATNAKKNGYVDLKMPVWTPGSYLIREYAKNVEGFTAMAANAPVRSEKIRKNAWRVYSNADDITLSTIRTATSTGPASFCSTTR